MTRDLDGLDRRTVLRSVGGVAAAGTLAGCIGGDGGGGESPTETSTATPTAEQTTTSGATVQGTLVKGKEWTFTPSEISATKGTELTITFKNVGSIAHNLTIGKFPIEKRSAKKQDKNNTIAAQTKTIQSGKTATVTFMPDQTGKFPFWCDVSGHRDQGMQGRIVVS